MTGTEDENGKSIFIQSAYRTPPKKGDSREPARAPHQVNGRDVPERHDSPDGLERVLGQVDEPVTEQHVL